MNKNWKFRAKYKDSIGEIYDDKFTVIGDLQSMYIWEKAINYALREEKERSSVKLIELSLYEIEDV